MNYNWDDIEVDDTLTHNSRYFFANYKCANVEQLNMEEVTIKTDSLKKENDDNNDGANSTNNLTQETFERENKENETTSNVQLPARRSKYSLRSINRSEDLAKCEDLIGTSVAAEQETLKIKQFDANQVIQEAFEMENKENEPTSNEQLPARASKYSLRSINKLATPANCDDPNGTSAVVSVDAAEEDQRKSAQLRENDKVNVAVEVDKISAQMDKVALQIEIAPENNGNQFAKLNDEGKSNKNSKSKPNIMTPSKWVQGAIPKTGPQPPRAYQFHNVYQNKHQELLLKQLEEERKKREFHSRPAPNFQYKPQLQNVHTITTAVTPQVLKRSKESQRKRLEKLKELKRNDQPQPFKMHEHNVRPYNLRCERRLQERKKFDQAVQRALEEKQKEEEERQKQEEEAKFKELRKATNFKARPNPFKN